MKNATVLTNLDFLVVGVIDAKLRIFLTTASESVESAALTALTNPTSPPPSPKKLLTIDHIDLVTDGASKPAGVRIGPALIVDSRYFDRRMAGLKTVMITSACRGIPAPSESDYDP